ncbi:MAG: peptide chain release factor 1 [Aquificaceae bacterium]|jgi:peptide chain release factor subunit 1|uniref:baeRF12 domain-containing protein n=1 Tax=Hydrogenobacter sp. Uz 6-8 TaxID=3384828 RepID=UPI0030ACAEA3
MKSLKDAIERLLSFRPDGYMVTNLYLRLGVEERTDRKYLRTFKDLVKAQKEYSEGWGLKDDVLKSVEEDFKKMEAFLSEPENLKGCRGIALFSSSARGLFEVIKLPYTYRNRLMLSQDPLIREIATIDEELGRIGILLIDRKHVRFFLMDLEGVEEVLDFVEPLATRAHRFHSGGSMLKGAEGTMKFSMPSRIGGPDMVQHSFGEYRFNMRIKEERHRLFKIAGDALMEAWKESKFDRLIIGSDREDVREIENHLHPYLLERLVGYININPSYVEDTELKEKVYHLLIQKSREEEFRLLDELKEMEGKGLAVNGTSKVLQQLYNGNVRLLLVPESFHKPGYVCERSRLPLLEPECPAEEKVYAVPDVINEVIELALEERARVKTVLSEEVQKRIDGLACYMRFAL